MQDDLKLLQGTWTVTNLKMEGQEMPDEMVGDAQIVIKGDRFTSTGMGVVYKGRLLLNATVDPRHVDMKFDAGPEKGNTNFGIYKLDGDMWKLCLATRGPVRPKKFASPAGSGFAVQTLTRGTAKTSTRATVKPAASKKRLALTSNAPATEIEGEWKMVSCITDGAPMEESAVQWVKRSTVGDQIAIQAGPQTLMKMTFTCDSSKSPKTIDYVHTAGTNKGKTQLGIYELQGDVLRICMGVAGGARAKKFESVRGNGLTLSVWKRL